MSYELSTVVDSIGISNCGSSTIVGILKETTIEEKHVSAVVAARLDSRLSFDYDAQDLMVRW
ncbi:MAG: hypothetical protein CL877_05735 [Dehalococcoidales bacterium]|nr:hypothetical protein [Dehalococcoidales bacterium]